MLIEGIICLIYRYDMWLFSLFGKYEVASEKFMSLERCSDIVRLQDLNIFCWDTVHTSSVLEPDFEMKYCIFSLVIGLKSKGMGVGMLEVII